MKMLLKPLSMTDTALYTCYMQCGKIVEKKCQICEPHNGKNVSSLGKLLNAATAVQLGWLKFDAMKK